MRARVFFLAAIVGPLSIALLMVIGHVLPLMFAAFARPWPLSLSLGTVSANQGKPPLLPHARACIRMRMRRQSRFTRLASNAPAAISSLRSPFAARIFVRCASCSGVSVELAQLTLPFDVVQQNLLWRDVPPPNLPSTPVAAQETVLEAAKYFSNVFVFRGLSPSTCYTYRLRNSTRTSYPKERDHDVDAPAPSAAQALAQGVFCTPPAADQPSGDVRILFGSCMGVSIPPFHRLGAFKFARTKLRSVASSPSFLRCTRLIRDVGGSAFAVVLFLFFYFSCPLAAHAQADASVAAGGLGVPRHFDAPARVDGGRPALLVEPHVGGPGPRGAAQVALLHAIAVLVLVAFALLFHLPE